MCRCTPNLRTPFCGKDWCRPGSNPPAPGTKPQYPRRPLALSSDWMRVAPGTDAAIWRPWSRETGEL